MTDDEGKLVWGLVRLGQTEERDEHNRNGSPTLPIGNILVRTGMWLLPKWIEILFKKEIMGMVHFLGSPTKIM